MSAPETPKKPQANYIAIFSAYCAGTELDELAKVFEVDLEGLKARANRENWKANRLSLPLVSNVVLPVAVTDSAGRNALDLLPEEHKQQLARIKAHRETNLETLVALRDDLIETVSKLRTGKLKMEKIWCQQGVTTREEVEPSISDRVNLANYANAVFNGIYRALGDVVATEKGGQVGDVPPPPAITIILPGAIAEPRQMRDTGKGPAIEA